MFTTRRWGWRNQVIYYTVLVFHELWVTFVAGAAVQKSFILSLSEDLDRSNVANAYVSGMKEELNMQGTAYNVSASMLLTVHVRWKQMPM